MATKKEIEKEKRRRVKNQEKDDISRYIEKDKQIKEEIQRIGELFSDIDESKKELVKSTIEDVAFLAVTMKFLRESISEKGTTSEYKNGQNQYGTKQSPDAQLYLQMSQKHTQAMKILIDCLPKSGKKCPGEDDFDDFVRSRD